MSTFEDLIRHHAEAKFGTANGDAITKWISYWTETRTRNIRLLEVFRSRIEMVFNNRSVLDIGCGSGGLGELITNERGIYFGLDYFPALLEIAQAFTGTAFPAARVNLMRASGTQLPLADQSVDCVCAFDVIEHLQGGEPWQRGLLHEVRRVLRQNGLLLLTTPNPLYPFEGHTFLYGPQYMPLWLADRYIKWKNPGFIREHNSFANIKLLNPWKLKGLLRDAGMKPIFDFPWLLDLKDYAPNRRPRVRLAQATGIAWAYTRDFWIAACRTEDWIALQVTKKVR